MLSKLLEPEIRALIDSKDWKNLKEVIREWEIPEIAELIHTLEPKDAVLVYKLLPRNISSDVFAEMDADMQETLVNGFANKELKQLIVDLSPDDRTELFEELPVDLTQKILNLLPAEERKEALQLLGYPDKSVGRLMTPDYISVQSDWECKTGSRISPHTWSRCRNHQYDICCRY